MDKRLEAEEKAINNAITLLRAGKHDEALVEFLVLNAKIGHSAVINGLLGDTFRAAGRIDEAAKHYAITVGLSPGSRLASLGLFHSLWDLGKKDDAANEAVRFDSVNSKTEYLEVLKEMKENDFHYPELQDTTIDLILDQLKRYPSAYMSKTIQDLDFDGTHGTSK